MAIIDVTVVPLGTKTPSMSEEVAEVQKVLEKNSDKITYKLTPMSTLIEGELSDLFDVIQQIHEVPFKNGVERVSTNIRLDDRRDKQVSMGDKVESVDQKL